MQKPETSFDNLPQMVEFLMNKVISLEEQIKVLAPPKQDRTIIDIDAAVELTRKTKSTIYKLSRTGKIPTYKRGKKLYFIKEELEQWMFTMPKHQVDTPDISIIPNIPQRKSALDRMRPNIRKR